MGEILLARSVAKDRKLKECEGLRAIWEIRRGRPFHERFWRRDIWANLARRERATSSLDGSPALRSRIMDYDGLMNRKRLELSSVISSPIILAMSLCAPIDAQTGTFDRLLGKNLWEHRPTREQAVELDRLAGSVSRGYMTEPGPWYIWKTDRSGRARYVMLLGESLLLIPGGTSACIQLFDATPSLIGNQCFQTGWRNQLISASLEYSEELSSDLVVIRTVPVINGRDIRKEYFAISEDRVRLVRLENSGGAGVQNEYVFPNYEIGAVPLAQTVEAWTSLLQSKDRSDVLSALVFLGGRHLKEPERQLHSEWRESRYAPLFQQLVASVAIRELISQLRNSGSPWIRDAAALAARDPRGRQLQ